MLIYRVLAKLASFLILLFVINAGLTVEAAEKPTVVVLFKQPTVLPAAEIMKLVTAVYGVFEGSGEFKPIPIDANTAFWPNIHAATKFSENRNADYMVYMDLSKKRRGYQYHATLMELSKYLIVAKYVDKWSDEPAAAEKAGFRLASNGIFSSLGKVTVIMTIESSPSFCDVYRDEYRLGHTGENGFRNTYFWEKGLYRIRVCKPNCNEFSEIFKVQRNPTEYRKKVILTEKVD